MYVSSHLPVLIVWWQLLKAWAEEDSEAQNKVLMNDLDFTE